MTATENVSESLGRFVKLLAQVVTLLCTPFFRDHLRHHHLDDPFGDQG
jgi:hypothetical protein